MARLSLLLEFPPRFAVTVGVLCVATAVAAGLIPIPVWGNDALEGGFASTQTRVSILFGWIRNVLFLVAGMALIALAANAYAGKLNIKWLVTVIVSVVLIAASGALTDYFVDTETGAPVAASTGFTTGHGPPIPAGRAAPGTLKDVIR